MADNFDAVIDNFDAVIDKIVADTEEKMLAVVKNSIQEVVEDAQTPLSEGGKIHVDTGFLRSSGQAQLNQIPKGEIRGRKRKKGEEGVLPEYAMPDNADYILPTLAKMKIGDTFYFGWTAIYALYQEIYHGFMESAVMKWKEIVDGQIRRLKK